MPLDPKQIGKTITHLRKKAGFTQKGLADRLFISDKAVSKWERGLSVPDISFLGKLSVLLDVDIDVLLEGKSDFREDEWKGFLFRGAIKREISFSTHVFDKPLVYYLLSYFLLVGIRDVLIVCTPEEKEYLQAEFGNGELLGMKFVFSCLEGEGRLHDAVCQHAGFFERYSVMTVFENNILYGASLTYLFRRAMLNHRRHTLVAAPTVQAMEGKTISFDENRRASAVASIGTQYNYYYLPVLFSPGELLLKDIGPDDKAETLATSLASGGNLFLEMANRGIVSLKIDSVEDVLEASQLIKIIQERSGVHVGCPEEIAWRRGLISDQQLDEAAQKHRGTQYGEYLHKLSGNAGKEKGI